MYLTGITDEATASIEGQIETALHLEWSHLDLRNAEGANVTSVNEATFDRICDQIQAAGLKVASFSSTVANWANPLEGPAEPSYEEMKRAIPRMHRLGVKHIRIMSFQVPWNEKTHLGDEVEREVISRVKHIVELAEGGGIVCLHENCNNWAGRSHEHTLRLLEAIPSPSLRLVFDTANPIGTNDCRGEFPFPMQSAWRFYDQVKDFIDYIHIKDARMESGRKVHVFPGEGDAEIGRILSDLKARGYDGGICIEPHVAVQYHDPSITSEEGAKRDTFIRYARAAEKLLRDMGWIPAPASAKADIA